MLDFTQDETALLIQDGYKPAFMLDIREGDLVAIAPVSRMRYDGEPVPVKTVRVERVIKIDASHLDPDSDEVIKHTIVTFIGINLDNLPEHCSYGNTYPCFIKREDR